jgi:putative chitinase
MPRYARRLGWRSLKRVATFPGDTRSDDYWRGLAKDLAYAMAEFDIWRPIKAAHFVSQLAHESGGFRWREELASGAAYEGRCRDLGNCFPGDGKRFKGRGYIQITGRANYKAVSKALGVDYVAHPEWLERPRDAARASAWWWKNAGLNEVATNGRRSTVERVTRRINGGYNGLDERIKLFRRAYPIRPFLTPSRRRPN